MALTKQEMESSITVKKLTKGYIIFLNDGHVYNNMSVTQEELEEIVRQALLYLRVPKGTKGVELKK